MAVFKGSRFIFCFFIFFATTGVSQNKEYDLKKIIHVKPGDYQFDALLHITSKQTGFVFSYSSQKLNVLTHILITENKINVGDILSLIKEKGMTFKIIENYIVINTDKTRKERRQLPIIPNVKTSTSTEVILKNKETGTKKENDSILKKTLTDSLANPNSANKKTELQTDTISIKTIVKKDSTNDAFEPKLKTLPISNPRETSSTAELAKKDSSRSKTVSELKPAANKKPELKLVTKRNLLFVKPGFTIDESSFAGVITQAGVPLIYATLSVNTNFKVSHLRYGLGSSFKINNKIQLHFNANFGHLAKSGFYYDSINNKYPIAVKSELTRYSMAVEFSFKKNLKIQIGPALNLLTTRYYINNMQSNLSIFKDGDHLFYTIYPPYYFLNTYSATSSSNLKAWLGLQLNIFYFLKF